ncbi:MAG: hypothetical protein FD161_1565 [Limisphaerales bacterium]|nr:MAG: hypothetical protein FD161_1565 [Limisphaerales bacterium]KAG0509379.1 MAG: hypothetical protein E1N63_1484 [Limisphaerales bacterium]TXT52124.1 MAG: hypothetical protein FD140_1057 [Limisphaerales bacterium]
MPELDATEIRGSFREFVGADRYRKFVRSINRGCRRKGRLFFWQEELWHKFVTNGRGAPTGEETVMDIFRICDVHDCNLTTLLRNDPPLEIRDTPEYDQAFETNFPFASGGDLICAVCRSERSRWISENLDLCRILRGKTTYEAYCDRLLEGVADPAARDKIWNDAKERIKKREIEIHAQMQPGDELWEWDGGGWHRFAGRAGVAVVRDGRIVKQWCEIKS